MELMRSKNHQKLIMSSNIVSETSLLRIDNRWCNFTHWSKLAVCSPYPVICNTYYLKALFLAICCFHQRLPFVYVFLLYLDALMKLSYFVEMNIYFHEASSTFYFLFLEEVEHCGLIFLHILHFDCLLHFVHLDMCLLILNQVKIKLYWRQ